MMSPKILAIIGLLLTNVFWAGNIYVSRIAIETIPPFSLNLIRWALACLILTPFVLGPTIQYWSVIRSHLPQLALFGFLGIAVYNAFLYLSLIHI